MVFLLSSSNRTETFEQDLSVYAFVYLYIVGDYNLRKYTLFFLRHIIKHDLQFASIHAAAAAAAR